MVHSTDVAAAVGAERLREIMAELVNIATGLVQCCGGTVDKFTGDSIMAVFGAPVALEDHAVRACRVALGIQDETVRLAAEVKDRDGIDLRLRVGLNSGQVIAGEVGSKSLGYTVVNPQILRENRKNSSALPVNHFSLGWMWDRAAEAVHSPVLRYWYQSCGSTSRP